MRLTSSAFDYAARIPEKYTCHGVNVNPPLTIEEIPYGTKSLVLIMHDPDAPSDFIHWIVFNIPPDISHIPEGSEPEGNHGLNSTNKTGYFGPCPPEEHRYIFILYALDIFLDLSDSATKHEIEEAMEGHVIGKTDLMGFYG